MYPPLPCIEPRRHDEPAADFGGRALAFLLQTRVTATLDDETLKLAEHASIYVVASRDICEAALEQVHAVRLQIAATLRYRKTLEAPAFAPIVSAEQPNKPAASGGQRVKRIPIPPTRPSPSAAAMPF